MDSISSGARARIQAFIFLAAGLLGFAGADPLTGPLDRRGFRELLQRESERTKRNRRPSAC